MKHDIVSIRQWLTQQRLPCYKLTQTDTASYEMFFVKGKLETVRRTDTRDLSLTVYVDHDQTTGSSTVQLYPSATEQELAEAVARAHARALLVFDEPYTQPVGGCEVYTDDGPLVGMDPVALAADIADVIASAPAPDATAVNALEIFVKDVATRVCNSCGVDKTQTKRTASFEYIPTCDGEGLSVELYQFDTIASLDKEALRDAVSAHMADVAARVKAVTPTEHPACAVLLPSHELRSLVRALTYDLSYGAAYNHSNLYQIGDDIQAGAVGDRLTVKACAQVPHSPAGAHFDADGTTLADRTLLREGVCVGRFGAHRMAQYLGEEATGQLPCVDVAAGTASQEQLRAQEYLQIVSMSGLQVDLFNDYIGGEVRLAYHVKGAQRIPVTGISISGKLREVLRTLRLSADCVTDGNYHGPAVARLDGMQIY